MATIAATITIPVTTNASTATTSMRALDGSVKKVDQDLKKVNRTTKKSQSSFRGLKVAAGAALAVLGARGLFRAFKNVIAVTQEQQKVNAQLNAVLKSTQHAAGLTAGEIKKMAAELQGVTIFGDEAIISAQNMLLTFTQIGADVFPGATEAVLNLSAAMGTDLKTQAIQVGKALNDPILGLTALRRVGIQLSAAQEKQVKQFVKLGDVAAAQKIILGELETQFGGVARAMTQTVGGAFEQLSNRVGDLQEDMGNDLTPELVGLADALFNAAGDGGIFQTALKGITTIASGAITILTNLINIVNRSFDKKLQNNIKEGVVVIDSVSGAIEKNIIAMTKRLKVMEANGDSEAKLDAQRKLIAQNERELTSNNEDLAQSYRDAKPALDALNNLGAKEVETLDKVARAKKRVTRSTEDATAGQKAALTILAQTMDLGSRLALQDMEHAEQRKTVLAAGLSVVELERFQAQQRLATIQQFKDQSIEIERSRIREINSIVQSSAAVAGDVMSIFQSLSQVRQNNAQSEINAMEAAGASEEALAKKRKELAKQAARDQKLFGTFSVIIDTATAVTRALLLLPNPAAFVLAALAATKGAAQLAVIQSAPVPAQFGGSFVVPPGNQADSGLLAVNQGEQVDVTPVRNSGAGGGSQILQIDGAQFEGFLVDAMNRNLNNGKVQIRRSGTVKVA